MVEAAKNESVDKGAFERARKKKIGSFLRALNSPEFIANQFTRYAFNSMDLFDVIPALEALSVEDADRVLRSHFAEDAMTVCTVRKKPS
jgi:predicted Zn-dependent peptidase